MAVIRNEDGSWTLNLDEHEQTQIHPSNTVYPEALPRYLTALDPAFTRAREKCECEFLFSLFRVRGSSSAGWDPYETTLRAIPALLKAAHEQIQEFEVVYHLLLWIYGHILEASEPYELLANLIDVANGGRFRALCFPPNQREVPQSPGMKIDQIERAAAMSGMPDVGIPPREAWNRDFRNAIFHADYTVYGGEVRTIRPMRIYTHEEVMTLLNRALA